MELYNSTTMPLSNNSEIKQIQEKQLRGEELSFSEKLKLGGRDHTITQIGNYECKKDCCYRAVPENVMEIYKQSGYIKDERRVEFIEGQNNQGIDWYLGGAMPGKHYGYIIIECPADKNYFVPSVDNGLGMSNDLYVRHMKSSPQKNPIPLSMITNVFDYRKVLEEQKAKFDMQRSAENERMSQLRAIQLQGLSIENPEMINATGGMSR